MIQKQKIFTNLRNRYNKIKKEWNDNSYDKWFRRDLNHARIATIGTYHDHVPAFQDMLIAVNGDMAKFYAKVEALTKLDKIERDQRLAAMVHNENIVMQPQHQQH